MKNSSSNNVNKYLARKAFQKRLFFGEIIICQKIKLRTKYFKIID